MSWDNKVVWSEGMFLRTHHFQQFDRYVEKLVRARVDGLRPYAWGLTDLELNDELLKTGKFAVTRAAGVLPDGTPFSIPGDVAHPPPLDLLEGTRDCVVYLTLPVRQPGSVEVERSDSDETTARYRALEFEAVDTVAGSETVAQLSVGKLRTRYMLHTQERTGYVQIGLAKIAEVPPDQNVRLDRRYIPPVLDCSVSQSLSGFLTELQGMLHHRGEALAGRLGATGTKGAAEISDFLLLQAVNRYEPMLAHYASGVTVHPESFYSLAIQIAGELTTFVDGTRRAATFPAYRHDDLEGTFAPVIVELRRVLSAVIEYKAVPIPLEERRYGIRIGQIPDRDLLTSASFVLAVKADVPEERLRRVFPTVVKIGPVEQIRDLVNSALPGVSVRALPVAPRQIPFAVGTTYFEMDRTSRFWKGLQTSGAMAIHLGGDFPQVQMECWAIKG